MEKPRILIIEDNADTRKFLETLLSKDFEPLSAENGVTGIEFARNKAPHLILLDIMLPILNGLDACSLLKQDDRTRRIPIIFLSAKNTPNDITHGLSIGADDYISKPFDYKELIARIKVRLRGQQDNLTQPIQVGDLRIEPTRREVSFGGKKAVLTLTEFDLLKFLAVRAGATVSRDDILREVWRDDSTRTNDRTIDVHIRSLRKKIPPLTRHIISIYGVGYKYEK
jgi:DNA-binding response OmpR family regulator